MRQPIAALRLFGVLSQMLVISSLLVLAIALSGYTFACAAGFAGWLILQLQFGAAPPIEAGWIVQSGATALVLGLLAYLPANRRILRLENSHRQFSIQMDDVARAYAVVHGADRDGLFNMHSEFDAVRERMIFLNNHPDLGSLEPGVLEVAAQMSTLSHELAKVYSTKKIERARNFLIQRQQELGDFADRIEEAKLVANDMRNWASRVELDEDVAQSELHRLSEILEDILPELAPEPEFEPVPRVKSAPQRLSNQQPKVSVWQARPAAE